MCILLCTRSHPDYPLIVLSNRDEYFERPTLPASFINESTLCPVDLGRKEHGTWIGITKSGRIAILVNYREPMNADLISKISRGSIPALFLGSDLNAADWAGKMKVEMNNFEDVGGFSLLFGQLRANHGVNTGDIEPLYIFSNRYEETVSVFNTQGHKPSDSSSPHDYKCSKLQYCDNIGLSNSPYLEPWPKVNEGKKLLKRVTKKSIEERWGKEELIENLFSVLSVAHPSGSSEWMSYDFETGFKQMPQSIFIPPLRKKSNVGLELERITSNPSLSGKYYGTRTQTIILVDRQGKVTYTERNLHTGEDLEEIPQTRTHVFDIEGWDNDVDESEKADRVEVKTRLSEKVRGNIDGEAYGEDLREAGEEELMFRQSNSKFI